MVITVLGYDTTEKEVRISGTGAAISLPKAWRGLRVKAVLLDPIPQE
jgi:putative transposon-encoded protein